MRRVVLFVVTLALSAVTFAGCRGPTRPPGELVQDIATWSALPDDEAMAKAAGPIVQRWQGQRVRWSTLALVDLCVDGTPESPAAGPVGSPTKTCAMNPFPRGGPDAQAAFNLGGMYPLYRLEAAAAQALHKHCAGLTTCVVDAEATLRKLVLDPEESLAVEFVDVVIHGGRPLRDGEPWARVPLVREGPKRALPRPPKDPSPTLLKPVAPRVF